MAVIDELPNDFIVLHGDEAGDRCLMVLIRCPGGDCVVCDASGAFNKPLGEIVVGCHACAHGLLQEQRQHWMVYAPQTVAIVTDVVAMATVALCNPRFDFAQTRGAAPICFFEEFSPLKCWNFLTTSPPYSVP